VAPGRNACFWFDVRSGGSVIGTHGSYARRGRMQHRRDPDHLLDRDPRGHEHRPAERPRRARSTRGRTASRPRS
jgi:hypothetical protein